MNEELETGNKSENKYALAGWLAITGAILLFPEILFGILVEIKPDKLGLLVFPYGIIAITEVAFTVYAFLRFKDLLNERYSFHQVDLLVLLIVIGSIVGTSFAVVVKHLYVFGVLEPTPIVKIATMTALMIIAIPLSAIGIVFGIKLLKVETDFRGLLKPMVYIYIAGSICFATFVLILPGVLLFATFQIMMGLILLREGDSKMEVEFV
ncbi:MAG: hypothetical protein HQ568_02450 [Calditrichaeota bacterium]|nr:hypothetical protein [Calditrichota bacterium]